MTRRIKLWIFCYPSRRTPLQFIKAFLILDMFIFTINTLLEILVQMGITNMFSIMYGASLSRIIIGSILGIPYIIYCAIMRCCITCILKDGTILRKFRFWKLIRSIVCAIILVTIITGRIFLWIGYFSFAEGSLESTTGISNQWFLIDNINEICRSVSGIYVFYGFKWVTRALSQLKRSDEFDGEYYSDNESKSEEDNKKKKRSVK